MESDDGFFLSIDSSRPDSTFSVEDGGGRTDVVLNKGGRRRVLKRGVDALEIELDGNERLRRVRIPGSARALVYSWDDGGNCEIKAAGAPWSVRLTEQGSSRCIEIAPGVGWRERVLPASVVLETFGDEGREATRVVLELDGCGRTKARTWNDGSRETFTRDNHGRLSQWTRCGAGGSTYRFAGADLAEEESERGTERRELDTAGRVRTLTRADGTRILYEYDGAGRRVARREKGRTRRYEYDVLGQLRQVVDDNGQPVEMAYDGLGRRLSVRRGHEVLFEHRDEAGRLWAVTDEDGIALHTFLWVGDRMVARLDGPVGSKVAEGFLCDPLGTLLAVIHPSAPVERVDTPPFGAVTSDARPTLYSHLGLCDLGLIHFGARDLDPELGLFLTPDPWHGGEDDPRRWAGASDSYLRRETEIPGAGAHDYAVCQFDPVGRSDRDGHVSAGDVFLHIIRWILLPTWGFPLTSLSVFFFMPLNLYMEIFGLIIFLFKQLCDDTSHPWGNHTIVKATGLLGSLRQFTFAFGLNGFLPRVIAGGGFSSDRAITVGNVIWINREELGLMDRPEVIELWDIAGPPGGGAAAGTPGGPFLADPNANKHSAVAVVGIDDDRKKRFHVSHWTRGFGNAVHDVAGQKTFKDEPVPPGAGFARGTLLLRKPLPSGFPYPDDDRDDEKLEVHEYVHDGTPGANRRSQLLTIIDAWFALKFPKDTSFAAPDWIQVEAPKASPAQAPTYREITEVVPAKDHAAVMLRHDLPTRFQNNSLKKDLRVQKVEAVAGVTASEGWNTSGGTTTLEVVLPAPPAAAPGGWPPSLTRREPARIVAAAPAVVPPAPPGGAATPEDTIFARVESLAVTLKLSPVFGAVGAPTDIFLQRPEGSPFQGVVEDPAAPTKIKFPGSHPSVGDLLLVTRPGANETAYVRATNVTGDVITVDPGLSPAITLAANTNVRAQKYVDSNEDQDKGTIASVNGDEVTVDVARSNLFPDGRLVRFQSGGARVLRKVDSLRKVKIEIADDVVGTAPCRVTKARLVQGRVASDIALAPPGRFLKLLAGDAPSTYGDYPNAILCVGSPAPALLPDVSAFYVKWAGARPGDAHKDFRRSFRPAQANGDTYWVLESPLPFLVREESGSPHLFWRTDDESEEHIYQMTVGPVAAAPFIFQAREYVQSGVRREDTGGRRITAHPPEVQVPVDPSIHDTHARALIEHEIHHTVQCNFWGSLMGALPLTGIVMLVSDIVQATGNTIPDWMREVELDAHGNPPATADGRIDDNTELNPFQVASIGGLMQLLWKYVFLGPALLSEDARKEILPLDFSDWNQVVNPVNRLLMDALPPVDPNADDDERWPAALGQLLERAVDLRSWTPFLGFLPFIVPSNPFSFIEQGASRASGDLYSTLLSANDRVTRTPSRAALGDAVRLMLFADYRTYRMFDPAHADRPGSPLSFRYTLFGTPPVKMTLPAGTALFHPDLYLVDHPGGPAPTRTIEGPPGRGNVDFVEASAGDTITPRLPSVVPSPPRVNRSMGFYFLPASHGTVSIDAEYSGAGNPSQDAKTQNATLTVEDEVKLGEALIAWALPPSAGNPPTTSENTFHLTERQPLKMKDRSIDGLVLVITPPAGPAAGPFVTETALADRSGWDLQIGATLPPAPVRIRLYRVIPKNSTAFDLTYGDVPTLQGVRSYLAGDVWIPIRDFHLAVQDIPVIPNATKFYDETFELDTVIPLVAEQRAFAAVPPAGLSPPRVTRQGQSGARGERWHMGPLDAPVEDDALFRVTVTYGRAPHAVALVFELTFRPRIHLPKHGGGADFQASLGQPLELDIAGGTAPYSVEADDLPNGATVAITGGNRVAVNVAQAPAASRSAVVIVRDNAGKEGRRTIRVVP